MMALFVCVDFIDKMKYNIHTDGQTNLNLANGGIMDYQVALMEHLQTIVGKRLDAINLACEMMVFSFEKYELHAQCLARIVCQNNILVTTLDYQSWDGEVEGNNDEWYFVEQNRAKIVGGVVTSVTVNALHDAAIVLDNGTKIELFIKNGNYHFDDEQEQWVFFKRHDHTYPFITVYNKAVDFAVDW